jgi:hypothetical protein
MAINAPVPNLISLAIPDADLQQIQAALQVLEDKLNPQLVDLGPEQRRRLAKLGPRSVDFVSRAMVHLREMPQYRPGFLDLDEFQRDLDALALLGTLQLKLVKACDLVEDSLMLAGSEAYKSALATYDALKSAAKLGSLDAKVAADDLAIRLPPRGPVKPAAKGAPVPHAAGPLEPAR